jgi:hypothetical protein
MVVKHALHSLHALNQMTKASCLVLDIVTASNMKRWLPNNASQCHQGLSRLIKSQKNLLWPRIQKET